MARHPAENYDHSGRHHAEYPRADCQHPRGLVGDGVNSSAGRGRRIAFAGSGGTGKTTLALTTAERYEIPYIKEGVREYMARNGIEHLRELTPEKTMDMQWAINEEKRRVERENEGFVTCRTFADHAAYALRWIGREKELQEELEDYVRVCFGSMNYDFVFFCPWGAFIIEDDGVRSSQKMYQLEMNYLILGILEDWKIKYHKLQSIDICARLDEIEGVLCGCT